MRLWNRDRPIIDSLLEIDVYKLLMLNFIDRFYPNLDVRFEFKNRTKNVRLTDYIDEGELREQLRHVEGLHFTEGDVTYLRRWGVFPEYFLRQLTQVQLSPLYVKRDHEAGTYSIQADGLWTEATLWETIVLAIVNELYTRGYVEKHGLSERTLSQEGDRRLAEKIQMLREHSQVKFAQFGLRRRFSAPWEEYVTRRLLNETPLSVVGVSNVRLAHDLGVEAVGTNAHELPMALYALARHESNEVARQASYEVLRKWQMLYGQRLLVMLPDTFGTTSFLDSLPRQYALDWRGFRQDSGSPVTFGEMVLDFYQKQGIDPRDKLIIFSDGLGIRKMLVLHECFSPKIGVSFGWGTNLTNDLGVPPLSLVMKLAEAAGRPTVKLSDNIAKATGPIAEIEIAKRIFGYDVSFNEQPRY